MATTQDHAPPGACGYSDFAKGRVSVSMLSAGSIIGQRLQHVQQLRHVRQVLADGLRVQHATPVQPSADTPGDHLVPFPDVRGLRRADRPEDPRPGGPRRPGRRPHRSQRPRRHGPGPGGGRVGAHRPPERRPVAVPFDARDARPVLQGPEGQPRRSGQVLRGRRVRHWRHAAAADTVAPPTAGGPE